jgi:hypothetical protein
MSRRSKRRHVAVSTSCSASRLEGSATYVVAPVYGRVIRAADPGTAVRVRAEGRDAGNTAKIALSLDNGVGPSGGPATEAEVAFHEVRACKRWDVTPDRRRFATTDRRRRDVRLADRKLGLKVRIDFRNVPVYILNRAVTANRWTTASDRNLPLGGDNGVAQSRQLAVASWDSENLV